MKQHVASVIFLLVLVGTASTQGQGPAAVVVDGKIDSYTGQLLIPARLGSTNFWCGLDSGFSALIALDQAKAERARLRAEPALPTPDGQPPRAGDSGTRVRVSVGGIDFGDRPIILRRFAAEAPEMDCVMGVSVLRQFVVELDYASARVRLHDRATYRPIDGAEQIPLIFRTNPNVPFVQIVLDLPDGKRQSAQVVPDTGTSYFAAIFVPRFVETVRAHVSRTALPAIRNDSSRPTLQLAAARLAAISVGRFTIPEPVVALVDAGMGGGMDDGTLGNGFFRRFTVAFDFEGHAMYLKPNAYYSEDHLFDASGVAFLKDESGYQVDFVLPDSPAYRAGIQKGDRLAEVDNVSVQVLTAVQLRDLMSHPGETRILVLLREGKQLHIVLTLETRL